ncbi:MAG TPA: hypothetical protein VM734_32565, partial [Kofleriaceae bacterium]|nr:hypothetical protein [Kofleriaceae bacterium]
MRTTTSLLVLLLLAACGSTPPGSSPDADDVDGGDVDAPAIDAPDDPGPDAAPPGDPFAALRALPGMCSADGWCWRTPTPHGNDYVRVFSTARDDIWLTAWGSVMQWDGHAWTFHRPPVLPGQRPDQFPMSIGGSSPTNTWLIYGTTLQQWDGATWTIRDQLPLTGNPNFNNVWVAPDGAAWVTQSNGVVKRWVNGTAETHTPCSGCFLGAIWGTGADDIFITTLPAGILHFDGTQFTSVYTGPKILGGYSGIRGDVWVSGGFGDLMHWDGTTMTEVTPPAAIAGRWIEAAGYIATNDVWWWVHDRPGFLHWDGAALTYTAVDAAQDGGLPPFNSVAIIDRRWWFVGDAGAIYTRTGADELAVTSIIASQRSNPVRAMWGNGPDNMYFGVGGEVRRWNGTATTTLPIDAANPSPPIYAAIGAITGLHSGGVDELFVSNEEQVSAQVWTSNVFHFDGTTWTKTQTDLGPRNQVRGFGTIVTFGPGEAFAVGSRGLAAHYHDGAWHPVETGTTEHLIGAWGPDPDNLWILGTNHTVLKWNRATPAVVTPDPIPTTRPLGPMHGAGGVAWIASAETGTVWRNAGAGWTELPAVTVGNTSGGLFAVGADDVVLSSSGQSSTWRWDGSAFAQETNASGYP